MSLKSKNTKYDELIKQEQIRSLFEQSVYLFIGIILLMIGVFYYFWDKANNNILIAWFIINFVLLFARAIFVKRFHKIKPKDEKILFWGKVFAFTSLLSGIIWGMMSVILLDINDLYSLVFVSVVLSGMVSASLVPLSSYIYAYICFSLPAMLPFIILMVSSSVALNIVLGVLMFISLSVHIGYSFIINKNMYDSFMLRFENIDLLDELEIEKKEADKANKDKSRFLTATSHDLRQPLHALDLYLGALRNILKNDAQRDLLEKSQTSSKALSELLNAMMDMSKLDSGAVKIEKQNINLNLLLDDIENSMRPQAEEKKIMLNMNVADVMTYSDPVLLSRVICNLLTNAIKHSEAKNISVDVSAAQNNITLTVIDDGVGITDIEIENIFSEFYQLNNPERDRTKGLGLGLAIVKRIVKQLDHQIVVDSKINHGSSFSITLPMVEVDKSILEQDKTELFDLSSLFIILIEDEESVRDATRLLLRSWDCEVLVGESLDAINFELDKAEYPLPDLIISDYRLRENKTGLEAIINLQKRFNEKIPAIVITGDTAVNEIVNNVIDEQCELVYKPVNTEKLKNIIANIVS